MNLPENLTEKLKALEERYVIRTLKSAAEQMSLSYREGERNGSALIGGEVSAAAYAICRMPATFAAVSTALKHTMAQRELGDIRSLLDVGAGTGTASMAVREHLTLENNVLLERDPDMLKLGQSLLEGGEWIKGDGRTADYPKADMVISSYMLNELPPDVRLSVVKKMWQSAEKLLLIVENGTPKGYEIINEIGSYARSEGVTIVAPCPEVGKCPVEGEDWCHFTCRVSRNRAHKLLKGGDAPYEDEKFTYIALSREKCPRAVARILRHPKIESGKITLTLCTKEGRETAIITKKNKAAFKAARKADAGDSFEF